MSTVAEVAGRMQRDGERMQRALLPSLAFGRHAQQITQAAEAIGQIKRDILDSPAMKAVRQICQDMERIRSLFYPMIEEQRLRQAQIAEFTAGMRSIVDQCRIDNILDSGLRTTADDQFSKSPVESWPTPARSSSPVTPPFTFSVDNSVTTSISTVRPCDDTSADAQQSRLGAAWDALTKEENREVVITLSKAGAATIVAVAGALHTESPVTSVVAKWLLLFGAIFWSRVLTLLGQGQTEPEAYRQAWREFFGPRLSGD